MRKTILAVGVLALFALVSAQTSSRGDEPGKGTAAQVPAAATAMIDFRKDIEPIFARACIECHGAKKQRGGLRLDSKKEAFAGSNSGAILKPGKSLESRLLVVIAGLDDEVVMPPRGRKPLTRVEIARIRAWIEQGADWPDDNGNAKSTQTTSDHWSFQPIRQPALPRVSRPGWVRNGIDAFVLARLDREKIEPSPEADRATLIRRLSLDLLGLPPTPAEVDVFVNDTAPDAYEKLVDRLLASPHYGERWGRHWLDLARYADTDGFEQDRDRPYAWRYRDWVIEAFNRDLPFDQFTIEQLAGDLLPGATVRQKTATGFHRNTLTNREGGTDKEQFRVEAVVDRVNTTAQVWLGMTLGCAQCHDHKYDPFSQREYYQMFAFFNSDEEVNVPALVPAQAESVKKKQAAFEAKKKELQDAVAEYRKAELPKSLAAWEKSLRPANLKKLPGNIQKILARPAGQRSEKDSAQVAAYYSKTDKKLQALNKALTDHQRTQPAMPWVRTLALGKGRQTHVLIRGDFLRPGVKVNADTPAVLPALPTSKNPERTSSRLDLARWLVDGTNPLTGRVIANWVWHHYFGRGLVETLEDFGTQGKSPSHPELLDHLATKLVAGKWSIKRFHKYIVTSATYRQSSKYRPELARRDPYNVLLARQNRLRLEAEVIRDATLAASGLLTRKIGGPSVRPPQPDGVSNVTYANRAKWNAAKGPDRYRRGMYTWFQRTSPYPMLVTFDAPDSNLACIRREKSNTPLQALTLMNDRAFVEMAQALGRRMVQEKKGTVDRLDHGFRLCLARQPSTEEVAALEALYADLLAAAKSHPKEAAELAGEMPRGVDAAELAAWVGVARTLLNLDEFVNRE